MLLSFRALLGNYGVWGGLNFYLLRVFFPAQFLHSANSSHGLHEAHDDAVPRPCENKFGAVTLQGKVM